MLGRIRKLANAFRKTPLHPQWFAFLREERNLAKTCQPLHGTVLDVGCADGSPKKYLSPHATYVGLDYFSTATDWYGTRPDIYGDAQSLPLRDGSVDHALLLDVLEHLPNPELCLVELHRVIKQGGSRRRGANCTTRRSIFTAGHATDCASPRGGPDSASMSNRPSGIRSKQRRSAPTLR